MDRIEISNLPVMQELETQEMKGIMGGAEPVGRSTRPRVSYIEPVNGVLHPSEPINTIHPVEPINTMRML